MEHMLRYLIEHGQVWVLEQREMHRPGAIPLHHDLRSTFEPFFGGELLDSTRFKAVPVIENPGFYRELEAAGQSIPLDFTVMHGITFEDTVLLSERYLGEDELSPGLLFHELVHVAQYRQLGVAEFVTRYIRGWAENGYDYQAIPLERDAYQLQERYERNPEQPFFVSEEVARRLRGGLEDK